jgi:alpha-glucosidase (family GH31 glycosyl hydrolase)
MDMKRIALLLVVCLSLFSLQNTGICAASGVDDLKANANYNPQADSAAMVVVGDVRITLLTERLVRLEWAEDKVFEDHATLTFLNRRLPVPAFTQEVKDGRLEIKTKYLTVKYKLDSGAFSATNLSIDMDVKGVKAQWQPGLENKGNLRGTTRTLDGRKGSANVTLEPGLVSRDGWAVVDDSQRPLFDDSDWPWVMSRSEKNRQDLYFFGYGHDYKAALGDFTKIAGNIALPPRFAFGTWWSRYWEYTDGDMRRLVSEFAIHDVPLEVLVVDMDWHITSLPSMYKDGKKVNDQADQRAGWTGFTWDKNHFPDPNGFLDWTNRQNLKTCMNLHPASGIQPHEDQYPAMARAMGVDPATKQYVPFDITNKKFAEAYLKLLLHPMEQAGIDFWWLDWQQWGTTKIAGVNPTFYLNYVYFSDMERQNKVRPLIFHRWGGLGNHRYQVGFSGDTTIDWESLDYQPYFTATAANVGFGFWSHDIGGHMQGDQRKNPELYTRWVQWGAFSPIFRTHCTKNAEIERRIWAYPLENFYAMRDAYLMRYAMLPYIYTAARQAYDTGISMCRPMYYDWPEEQNAYAFKNEYMFGNDVLVNPVTHPMEQGKPYATQKVWLPEGEWIEWCTGSIFKGPQVVERSFALDEMPVYVKAGAIIPMAPKMNKTDAQPVNPMILSIFPGSEGRVSIYEDEGNNQKFKAGGCAFTDVHFKTAGRDMNIVIEPVKGQYDGMLKARGYEVRLVNSYPPVDVKANGKAYPYDKYGKSGSWNYDGASLTTCLYLPEFDRNGKIEMTVVLADEDAAKLSGKKGQFKRLADFVLRSGPADEPAYEFGVVVRTSQTGLILSQTPELAAAEIRQFDASWDKSLEVIEGRMQKHAEWAPRLEFLKKSSESAGGKPN